MTVSNHSNGPMTEVRATDALPEGVDWTSWSDNCTGAGPTFTCFFGTNRTRGSPTTSPLLPGTSDQATLTVKVTFRQPSITNRATVTGSTQARLASASATVTTEIQS